MDKRCVENRSKEEYVAFNLWREAIDDLFDREQDELIWEMQNSAKWAESKELLEELLEELKSDNSSYDDLEVYNLEVAILQKEVDDDKTEDLKIKEDTINIRKIQAKLKREYFNVLSKCSNSAKVIKVKIDNLLKELGIVIGVAHDGDLQGLGCTRLIQKADELYVCAMDIGLEEVQNGTVVADEVEVQEINKKN